MQLSNIVAPVSVAVLTILSALPWGVPAESRFVLPLLPVVAIHYWVLRDHARSVPEWFVFLCGLLLDVLTNGPLGFWSLIYLLAYAAAQFSVPLSREGPLVRWMLLIVALTALSFTAWISSSIYAVELVDWQPFAWGALAAGAIHPVFALLLLGAKSARRRGSNVLFERGV
jgi:rod shape-determining protein MreD